MLRRILAFLFGPKPFDWTKATPHQVFEMTKQDPHIVNSREFTRWVATNKRAINDWCVSRGQPPIFTRKED
jgi:hypothetical protein